MHTLKATCARCGKKDAFVTTRDGYRCICGNYVPYRIDRPLSLSQAISAIMDGMVLKSDNGERFGYLSHYGRFQARFVYINRCYNRLEEIMGFDLEDHSSFKCVGRWVHENGRNYYSHTHAIKNVENEELSEFEIYQNILGYEECLPQRTYQLSLR